jgi:hypothetical protein
VRLSAVKVRALQAVNSAGEAGAPAIACPIFLGRPHHKGTGISLTTSELRFARRL